MAEIILKTYGKINLGLDILNKREDDYHNINTIMQSIDLYDFLRIKEIEEDRIIIKSNNGEVPLGEENLVYKVWNILKDYKKENYGVEVYIDKKIPVAAGLAGGSTNGAGMLKGLNKLWKLNLQDDLLLSIGKSLGADIPFCLMGGTAKAEGIGEILSPIKPFSGKPLILINMGIPISTKDVYKSLDLNCKNRLNVDKIIEGIEEEDLNLIRDNISNKMEEVVIEKKPFIREIKEDLIKTGGKIALMSGSGPTVFGIYEDVETRDEAYKRLVGKYMECIVVKTETI